MLLAKKSNKRHNERSNMNNKKTERELYVCDFISFMLFDVHWWNNLSLLYDSHDKAAIMSTKCHIKTKQK